MEAKDEIHQALDGADMVFITAGLGGGTGTGAAPVIAEIAKGMGILTVAVVTRPFKFEGPQRMQKANEGLDRLREFVDTCIIVKPGYINVDFADVRAVMSERGLAMMGIGEASEDNAAVEAVQKAINSPLLENQSIKGARGVLLNFTHASTLPIYQLSEASKIVHDMVDREANIIFGDVIEDEMDQAVRVTVIATGFDGAQGSEAVEEATSVAQLRPYTPKPAPPKPAPEGVTYLRKGQAKKVVNAPQLPLEDLSEEVLDIPTFLRRQAD
jgi:cell division protein FtsZ